MNHLITLSQKALLICSLSLLSLSFANAQDAQMAASPEQDEQGSGEKKSDNNAAADDPRNVIDTEQQSLILLTQEIDEQNVTWLEAGNEKFMGLWQADTTGNPFGAILILHGEGQSVDEPHEINAMRNNLIHYGWATLSIHLPALARAKIPPRPEPKPKESKKPKDGPDESSTQAPPDADADKTPENQGKATTKQQDAMKADMAGKKKDIDPEAVSRERLHAAIAFLKEQGQYNIVLVGHGVAATRALKYVDHLTGGRKSNGMKGGKIQRPIRAAVLISARNLIPQTGEHIRQYYSDQSLPILDLYYGDHYLDEIEVSQRAKIARSKGMRHYYQLKVLKPSDSDNAHENRLTRRVRGFLNKHAKGVEIEKK